MTWKKPEGIQDKTSLTLRIPKESPEITANYWIIPLCSELSGSQLDNVVISELYGSSRIIPQIPELSGCIRIIDSYAVDELG
jgi:hypothetical protein